MLHRILSLFCAPICTGIKSKGKRIGSQYWWNLAASFYWWLQYPHCFFVNRGLYLEKANILSENCLALEDFSSPHAAFMDTLVWDTDHNLLFHWFRSHKLHERMLSSYLLLYNIQDDISHKTTMIKTWHKSAFEHTNDNPDFMSADELSVCL